MKEQIDQTEELARDIYDSAFVSKAVSISLAIDLTEKGYSKKSEGEWKKVEEDLGGGVKTYRFACTNCGFLKNTLTGNFCPKCGAKMKGGE